MQDSTNPAALNDLSTMKFGVGQPVRRTEDPTLVRGQGRYTDDINLDGQVYAVMVRSRDAHGLIKSIDIDAARAMPGVLGIYTRRGFEGLWRSQMRAAAQEPRRLADQIHAAARAADRQGEICR